MFHETDPESFLVLKTEMGSQKPRFDSLGAEAQRDCMAVARRRFAELRSVAWVHRHGVIFVTAAKD